MQKIVKINKSVEREFIRSLLLTSLFVFVSLEPAAAQWRQVLSINEPVNRTFFVPNCHIAVAASFTFPSLDSSSIWRSTDNGETWTRSTFNDIIGAGGITDFAFEDSLTGWASVASGYSSNIVTGSQWVSFLWKTTDGGATWFPLDGPKGVQIAGGNGLYYNSYNNLLIVDNILLSTNGGNNWLPPYQQFAPITGYFFLDSTHGAGGFVESDFATTSDGGYSWQNASFSDSGYRAFPCGIRPSGYVKNGHRYYIVASPESFDVTSDSTANTIVLTSDDGATWDSISTISWGPGPNHLNFINGDIEKDCNIFYLNAGDSGFYRSDDSGNNWRCIGGPPPVGGGAASLFSVKAGRILAGGGGFGTYGIWLYTPPAYALQFSEDTVRAQIGAITEIPIQITNANGTLLFDSSSFEFDYDTNAFIFEGIESSAGYLVRFQKNLNGSVMITLIRDTLNTAPQDTATVTVDFQPILTVPQKDSSYVMVHSALFNDLSVCAPVTQSIASALVNIELGCGDSTILAFMQGKPLFSIVSIQPNPASSELTVSLVCPTGAAVGYELYDALGTLHQSGNISANVSTLDVSTLPSGIYYLRFSSNGYAESRTIAIAR